MIESFEMPTEVFYRAESYPSGINNDQTTSNDVKIQIIPRNKMDMYEVADLSIVDIHSTKNMTFFKILNAKMNKKEFIPISLKHKRDSSMLDSIKYKNQDIKFENDDFGITVRLVIREDIENIKLIKSKINKSKLFYLVVDE